MQTWNELINYKVSQLRTPKTRLIRTCHKNKFLITDSQKYLNFISNDYLGLSLNPKLNHASITSMTQFGFGSTGAPSLSGYTEIQQRLELAMASWLGFEKCLLFNSGYQVGIGLLSQLKNKNTWVWIDKNVHASHIDGLLLAKTKFKTFKPENISTIIDNIQKMPNSYHIIMTEGSFSMDGTCSYLNQVIKLRQESSNILLIIDDAHGIGALGMNGFGTLEQLNLDYKYVDLLIGTFAKSFGSYGGFICGNSDLITYLQETVRSQIYSSCLPPLIYGVSLISLAIIKSEEGKLLRQDLANKIKYFRTLCIKYDLPIKKANYSPIQLLMFKDNQEVNKIYNNLLCLQILTGKMLYPTVPIDSPRIRISLNTNLSLQDIKLLCTTVKELI